MENENISSTEEYSLNDDRRVRTLSPGALVVQRFVRNRVAVTGLIILLVMFLFSFVGGAITPYEEDQIFYTVSEKNKTYASVKENTEMRYVTAEGAQFPGMAQAKFVIARKEADEGTFESDGITYSFIKEGDGLYQISQDGAVIAYGSVNQINIDEGNESIPFDLQYELLKAYANSTESIEYDGTTYEVDEDGAVTVNGSEVCYISAYVVQSSASDIVITRAFRDELIEAIESEKDEFTHTNEDGEEATYTLKYDATNKNYAVQETVESTVFDTYHSPTKAHWLGTDRNGMDMLTRLMYGGRVSLYIGFIVVFIESLIGVVLGGVSGYFGGWIDNLIMRIVDVFYCIPSMPVIIILGAAMDALRVDPQLRMFYLMLILGFLGWPSIARLVRGQILSLREQEFMMAAEATGIKISRRIFKHLIPNVIPQLIVIMTMSLGDTIITEATLSFLGLGVKFPFASWGNIINDVNDTYVLTNYWFIWIPAGVCLLSTVLAFNLVGDGLRDAFDPKMKR